jgi:16S rRNA (cytosine967-C5)-methyltransferase
VRGGASMPGLSARRCAYRVLVEYEFKDAYLNIVLSKGLDDSDLDRRDRALVTEIVQGTVRMKLALDRVLGRFSSRELGSLDPRVLWLLRMSAYQVLFTSVAEYAACNLAADLARSEIGEQAVGFVNGVLRALVRGRDLLEWPDARLEPGPYLEIRHSHPRWVVEMWIEQLGLEKAESLCAADNIQPSLSLRCNLARTSREDLLASLTALGIDARPGELAPEAVLASGAGAVAELEGYRRGLFSVQDQGSMVAGRAVHPLPGMRVLDMCAAPGGKANHLAELMGNRGTVLALDLNPARLRQVEEAAERLGNDAVEVRVLDATYARAEIDGFFDRVLLDAPCTGLGTLGRRPDVRWRKSEADVVRLSGLQRTLIDEAAKMLRPGGLLVYSTCTISRRENQEVVESFLSSRGDFELVDAGGSGSGRGPFVELFPDTERCDGMFIATMRMAE